MDYDTMVGIDFESGRKIVQHLEASGIDVPVAFWAKLAEYGQWRFFIASPEFDRMGLFQAYGAVAEAENATNTFDVLSITILDMNDPIVKGLQQRIHTELPTRGLRITGQVFGTRAIEDGILERVA